LKGEIEQRDARHEMSRPQTSGSGLQGLRAQASAESRLKAKSLEPCSLSSGACRLLSALDDDRRIADNREVPRRVVAVTGKTGVGIDDQVHLLARVGREVGSDRKPAAVAGVVRRVDMLVHELVVLTSVAHGDPEQHAVALLVPGLLLDAKPCAEP